MTACDSNQAAVLHSRRLVARAAKLGRNRTMKSRPPLLLSVLLLGTSVASTLGVLTANRALGADKRPPGPKLFLVVAPERFRPALREYIDYKRKHRPTEMVSLEEVLKSSPGVDAPERLKRYSVRGLAHSATRLSAPRGRR